MSKYQPVDSSNFDPYQPENIPLFEIIYGKNLISLGGLEAVDNMFSDLKIKDLKALDIGFGLGGIDVYLAEKYHMDISGVEINSWMVQYAREQAPRKLALRFDTYSESKLPYGADTFDLVFSKGVLNHISDKSTLFSQIHAVLKPNGLFVIADWIFPKVIIDNSKPLVCETKESYVELLTDAGFSDISFRDDSRSFLGYVEEFLNNLVCNKDFIQQKYGEQLFVIIQEQHESLVAQIKSEEK